jgi:hypothetical protein
MMNVHCKGKYYNEISWQSTWLLKATYLIVCNDFREWKLFLRRMRRRRRKKKGGEDKRGKKLWEMASTQISGPGHKDYVDLKRYRDRSV